ncbi:MAG: enoyl-CoA hydratase/isomerase family protein [Deltaproteobacteria bacterium]|nr:MAG: enoyl-CoA hydratase/isomerase family protein [Deltaproteobacteria bacterium]
MARIELRKRGAIGEIRLNRPEVLNAQGRDWPADLLAAAAEMQKDASVRVVLVTGEGRSFCSGLDLTQLAQGDITVDWFHRAELALRALETMDKVVIAGVQGHCIGGGLQVIITCDVRIAADDAVLGLPAAREAFLPGLGTYRLPRLIGMGHARHLILSGETIGAEEALRIGLVNRVVARRDLEGELEAYARRYLEVPAPSLTWAKRLSNQAFDLPFERFLEELDRAMAIVLVSEEHQAARRAWLARKAGRGDGER